MYIKKLLISIIIIGWVSQSVFATNSFYYTPEGSVKERLREGIEYAQQRIDMCIHNFAALDINDDLEIARSKGVRVRVVILENGNNTAMGQLAELLIRKGFDTRVFNLQIIDDQVQDFILFDDRILVTGTYNWLAYQNRNICNDVLFYHERDRIRNFKSTFYRLFTEGVATPFLNYQKEWIAAKNPPASDTVSGTSEAKQIMQNNILNKEPTVVNEPAKTVPEVISQDFINISFEELDKQFGKESTLSRSEKNKLWKKYKGKYIRWNGVVSYKGMGRVDWNRIGVSRQRGKNAEVEILFDWRQFEKVMQIYVGSQIQYTGKLVSRSGLNAPYRLDDGNIE